MKKALLIALSLFFCFNARSQSLTFKDLLNLYQKQNAKSFLTAKQFSVATHGPGRIMYLKTDEAKNVERVVCNVKAVSYTTSDAKYIQAIMKQIPKQYKLISKDPVGTDLLYQYGNSKLSITVDLVAQKSGVFSSISLGKKE